MNPMRLLVPSEPRLPPWLARRTLGKQIQSQCVKRCALDGKGARR